MSDVHRNFLKALYKKLLFLLVLLYIVIFIEIVIPLLDKTGSISAVPSVFGNLKLISLAGSQECSECRLVAACSPDHLGRHRSRAGRCLPFRIKQDPVKGRCVIATRSVG